MSRKPIEKKELLRRERLFLGSLSPSKRVRLWKLYPYRTVRNRLIQALFNRGIPQCLLSKASGLSIIQIARIVNKKRERR
jgi:hypothetical protein